MKRLLIVLSAIVPALLLAPLAEARVVVTPSSANEGGTVVTPARVSSRTLRKSVYEAAAARKAKLVKSSATLDATYKNDAFGVQLDVSSAWDKRDLNQVEGNLTLVVMFLSPSVKGETIRQNINLVVEDVADRNMTLNEYTEMGLEKEKSFFDSFVLESSVRTVIAGKAAQRVVFSTDLNGQKMKFQQVWFFTAPGKVHVWTFADSQQNYAAHVTLFEHMMASMTVR